MASITTTLPFLDEKGSELQSWLHSAWQGPTKHPGLREWSLVVARGIISRTLPLNNCTWPTVSTYPGLSFMSFLSQVSTIKTIRTLGHSATSFISFEQTWNKASSLSISSLHPHHPHLITITKHFRSHASWTLLQLPPLTRSCFWLPALLQTVLFQV